MVHHPRHRKQVRDYDQPGDVHEQTFSCYRRLPLLTNRRWWSLLSESIERALREHGFWLVAFVSMPEHVHLLVYPFQASAKVDP